MVNGFIYIEILKCLKGLYRDIVMVNGFIYIDILQRLKVLYKDIVMVKDLFYIDIVMVKAFRSFFPDSELVIVC